MRKEHERFWNKESCWVQATAIGMTPEEVSTLASIVEEETNNEEKANGSRIIHQPPTQRYALLRQIPQSNFARWGFLVWRITNEHLKSRFAI